MAENGTLRRTKSLKNLFSSRKAKREEEQEPVPLPPIAQSLIRVHIAKDDIAVARSGLSPKILSQRNTWPQSLREKTPGSYSFDTTPTLIRTPWEYDRSQRRSSQGSRNSSEHGQLQPGVFAQLPTEILDCIVGHLPALYTSGIEIDVKSMQDDLRSLCLLNKRTHQVAQEHLYRKLWVPGNGGISPKTVIPFRKRLSRLELLLRTLNGAPALAAVVRELSISTDLVGEVSRDSGLCLFGLQKGSCIKLLAEIISCCKNVEQVWGLWPMIMVHITDLSSAIFACRKIKSHPWYFPGVWIPSDAKLYANALVDWQHLETLVLSDDLHGDKIPLGTVSAIVQRLPALRHLMVNNLQPDSFHNGTLFTLPALKSLRLEDLSGITDRGVEQLVNSRMAFSLERLSLVGLELTSLHTVQTLFTNLTKLRRFALVQKTSPELQQHLTVTSRHFALGSASVEYLHWDTTTPGHSTAILANSIAAGQFPKLRTVKAPWDYDGAVQDLCRPIAMETVTSDDVRAVEDWEHCGYERNYRVAKIQAQLRLRERRKQPSFDVVVQDEDDSVHKHVIGSYLGNMNSPIEFSLDPAIPHRALDLIANPVYVFGPHIQRDKQISKGKEELHSDPDILF